MLVIKINLSQALLGRSLLYERLILEVASCSEREFSEWGETE